MANAKDETDKIIQKDEKEVEENEEVELQKPKTKKKSSERKLKMKVEKILLDNNKQTEEALKHIYTVLHLNGVIEITIDFPVWSSQPFFF